MISMSLIDGGLVNNHFIKKNMINEYKTQQPSNLQIKPPRKSHAKTPCKNPTYDPFINEARGVTTPE